MHPICVVVSTLVIRLLDFRASNIRFFPLGPPISVLKTLGIFDHRRKARPCKHHFWYIGRLFRLITYSICQTRTCLASSYYIQQNTSGMPRCLSMYGVLGGALRLPVRAIGKTTTGKVGYFPFDTSGAKSTQTVGGLILAYDSLRQSSSWQCETEDKCQHGDIYH
jgi:hypothetical protein